jgi:hypothetical protein
MQVTGLDQFGIDPCSYFDHITFLDAFVEPVWMRL